MDEPLDIDGLMARVISHAQALGVFDQINGHEPKSAPGNGVTAAVWAQDITPLRSSGLSATSVRLGLMWRLYTPMTTLAPDTIDPNLIKALDRLCAAYTGDFDLGGVLRMVDLIGAYGEPMGARAGYLNQGGADYRVMDLVLPLICNDVWNQEA